MIHVKKAGEPGFMARVFVLKLFQRDSFRHSHSIYATEKNELE
jgi:hypothetical protein